MNAMGRQGPRMPCIPPSASPFVDRTHGGVEEEIHESKRDLGRWERK